MEVKVAFGRLAVRRNLATGRHRDYVMLVNLASSEDRTQVLNYFLENNVVVAVLAPSVRTRNNLDRILNPGAAQRYRENVKPTSQLCGMIAEAQLRK